MTAMATVLTQFNDTLNQRTWVTSGHTAQKPHLVMQKRKPLSANSTVVESTFQVVYGTADVNSAVLPNKVIMELTVRYPILGATSDTNAAMAVLRDIVASDEFANAVATQQYLK